MFFTIFYDEKRVSRQKKKNSKSRKIDIFPKGKPMVLVEKWPFFQLFFFGNKVQQNVFDNILRQKNAFLRYKNKKFKKSKNWHFSRGVNPWFWSKYGHFSNFFLGNISQENVFYDILRRKNPFLSSKNKKFKKSKNWHFFQSCYPWFWSKYGDLSNSFF